MKEIDKLVGCIGERSNENLNFKDSLVLYNNPPQSVFPYTDLSLNEIPYKDSEIVSDEQVNSPVGMFLSGDEIVKFAIDSGKEFPNLIIDEEYQTDTCTVIKIGEEFFRMLNISYDSDLDMIKLPEKVINNLFEDSPPGSLSWIKW